MQHNNPGQLSPHGYGRGRGDESIKRVLQQNDFDHDQVHTLVHGDTTQEKVALTEPYQYLGPGFYRNNELWAATDGCNIDLDVPHQFSTPYDIHVMNNSLSTHYWPRNEYMPKKVPIAIATLFPANIFHSHFSSTSSIPTLFEPHPTLFQPHPTSMQEMPALDTGIHPLTSPLVDHRNIGGPIYTAEQELGQASSAATTITQTEDTIARVGSVLSNGKFACDTEGCAGRTFGRHADLIRHHRTLHATDKPNYWCPVSRCRRSMGAGGEAFNRKDKLAEHIRRMHPGVDPNKV